MATTRSNTFFARPVMVGGAKETVRANQMKDDIPRNHVKKHTRFASEVEMLDPPPRPPPPRPSRVPKQPEYTSDGRERKRRLPPTPQEQKPLTTLNVTSHDRLWQKEDEHEITGPTDVLSPPLNYITPESTEEMVRNYDPNDVMDSMSERSDSSADTMIMMTTEEERKNQEKITHNYKQFTSKTKPDRPDTNRTKGHMQTKKGLHIKFSDTNGLPVENHWQRVPNGCVDANEPTYSKVVPLHIRTYNDSNSTIPESANIKTNGNHRSPNDSPDDGYGTNSSSGTVSSPFSSSFGSNDFENSYNGNSKRIVLPNGAIKPNSVRESWAVKRKQRMIEAEDNSLQEQLRHLTVIEEEGSRGSKVKHDKNLNRPLSGQIKPSEKIVMKNSLHASSQVTAPRHGSESDSQYVHVSQNDLQRINQQLHVIASEREAIQGNRRYSDRSLPKPPVTNEINSGLPQSYSNHVSSNSQNQNSDDVFTSETVNHVNSVNGNNGVHNWEDESDISGPDSMNSGPFLLRGGGDPRYRLPSGSGKIYVSPTGDEGFYSLNRSSRSTSVSSFQPINEVNESVPETSNGEAQRSPLEALSGELLEKWSDMDRNYRNYYGFDENADKYSQADSKVNYFQEKKINTMYGQDNYYRPPNYGSEPALNQNRPIQGQSSSQGPTNQGLRRDSKERQSTSSSKSTSKEQSKSGKEKDGSSTKSKFFQILPSMFKPTSKKQNGESKEKKGKGKQQKKVPVIIEHVHMMTEPQAELEHDPEAEYINMSDVPQYSVAQLEHEEKLKKGHFVSLENLHKRPVFASSRDINKLFSTQDQSFDSINSPGAQRHSFHAMPLSYRHKVNMNPAGMEEEMRPRAQSTSATVRSLQLQKSVDSRMALIACKNAAVMNQARQAQLEENKPVNLSFHSNSSIQRPESRSRLNSGDSSGDSKLSTLV